MKHFLQKMLFAIIIATGTLFSHASFAANCGENQLNIDDTCYAGKFAVKTTPLDTNGTFQFRMTAAGTFTVNCVGGTLTSTANDVTNNNTITRNNTKYATYTCTWNDAGSHLVVFVDSTPTGYSNNIEAAISFTTSATKIASIYGSLGAVFRTVVILTGYQSQQPKFYQTFHGASNMTGTDIDDPNNPGMKYALPPTLFNGIYGAPVDYMFTRTFAACSNLTGSIPENLFAGIYGAPASSMFVSTFEGCSGLIGSIPGNLFAGIYGAPASSMFYLTFYGCSGLSGYIPPRLFAGISRDTTANYQMSGMFSHSGLATSCESYGLSTYDTGFGSYFDSKVSCASSSSTVTLYQNNGTNNNNGTIIATFNQPMPNTSVPTRSGYVFMGYYDLPNGGLKYYNADMSSANNWMGGADGDKLYAHWVESTAGDFQVIIQNTDSFRFKMSAAGMFTVNCGGNGALYNGNNLVLNNIIERNDNTETTYECRYPTIGNYMVGFSGTPSGYTSNTAAIRFHTEAASTDINAQKIASIRGSLGAVFGTVTNPTVGKSQPRFSYTFHGASNMTGTDIDDPNNPGMKYALPPTLFNGVNGAPVDYMFSNTFEGCSNLTGSIPATLFAGIYGTPAGGMFSYTFNDCSNLTGPVPATLFAGISGAPKFYMFEGTFYYCRNLSGYIPPRLFAGISRDTTVTGQMENVFYDTGLATSCTPYNMTNFDTGFGTYFDGKVSCAPSTSTISTITLYKNDGTNNNNGTIAATFNQPMPSTSKPTRSGYVFMGYYDLPTGGMKYYNANMSSANNWIGGADGDKLYAQWTPKYTVTYHDASQQNWTNGIYTDEYIYNETYYLLINVSNRTGYNFGGWYDNSALSGNSIIRIPAGSSGNKEYWAKWTPINYSISFNLNGGSWPDGVVVPTSYTVESNTITLPTPVRNGYTVEWYDNSAFSGNAITTIPTGSTGNKNFWAKWTEIKCEANYYGGGNTCLSCSTETNGAYPYSDYDSKSINKCYNENCTAQDIEHATSAWGRKYYDGTNACMAEECDEGYWPLDTFEPETIRNGGYDNYGYVYYKDNSGEITYFDQNVFGEEVDEDYYAEITNYNSDNNSFAVNYGYDQGEAGGSYGFIFGHGRCSTQQMPANGRTAENGVTEDFTNGQYCWCQINSSAWGEGEMLQPTQTPWIFNDTYNSAQECASDCAMYCASRLYWGGYPEEFIDAVYNSYPTTGSVCNPLIDYIDYYCGGEDNEWMGLGYATYGESYTPMENNCTAPEGYVFAGWSVSYIDPEEVVQPGVPITWPYYDYDYDHDEYKFFTAKWRPECSEGETWNAENEECTQSNPCPANYHVPTNHPEMCFSSVLHLDDTRPNDIVYLKDAATTSPALNIDIDDDGVNDGYANMTTTRTPMSSISNHYLKITVNGVLYYVCDDTSCPSAQ